MKPTQTNAWPVFRRATYWLLPLLCLAGVLSARGGEIAFRGPFDVPNDADGGSFRTEGEVLLAGNARGDASSPAVNGITFEQLAWNKDIVADGVIARINDLVGAIDYNAAERARALYDANGDLAELMGVGYKSKYYGNGLVLEFSGLTPGKTYQAQGL